MYTMTATQAHWLPCAIIIGFLFVMTFTIVGLPKIVPYFTGRKY